MSDLKILHREYITGPGHYEDQETTFTEIYDLWKEGELMYELAKMCEQQQAKIERLTAEAKEQAVSMGWLALKIAKLQAFVDAHHADYETASGVCPTCGMVLEEDHE